MSDKFIDKLKKLDKERTQGDWEVVRLEDFPNIGYLTRVKGNEHEYNEEICDDLEFYATEVTEENQRFIAEAPRMARTLTCIHTMCKAAYEYEDPRLILKMIEAMLEKE